MAASFSRVRRRQPSPRTRRRLSPASRLPSFVRRSPRSEPTGPRSRRRDPRGGRGRRAPSPALFSLPRPGRLLVTSDAGSWVVQQDGSRRLLGAYRDATWSPFGRFVVAATSATSSPRSSPRAASAGRSRARASASRAGPGSATDTRIAYLSADRPPRRRGRRHGRLVVGAERHAGIPPAWRPGSGSCSPTHRRGGRAFAGARSPRQGWALWTTVPPGPPQSLEWSSDGRLLLVLSPRHGVSILDGD